ETAKLITDKAGIKDYAIGWQSEGNTPDPWLGPDVQDLTRELHEEKGFTTFVYTPVGFVSDHLEVLYDNDYECKVVCDEVAAFYLHKWSNEQGIPLEIKLYEASNHLGGKVQTVKQDGFTMERGADSFLARKKPGMKLMEDLRLEDQLYRNKTGQSYVLVHNQ